MFLLVTAEISLSKISPQLCTTGMVLEKPKYFRQKQM